MVQCACGEAAQRDGVCRKCRLRALGQARRKYVWTEELREELRAAYRLRKFPRARALDRMSGLTKWPRHALKVEAIRLRLVTHHTRAWSREEEEYLRERAGVISVAGMARKLGRSQASVESRLARLKVSRKPREGYTLIDLRDAFGAHRDIVKRWMDRGLLGAVRKDNGLRVSDEAVVRFLREHPREYDLRRVDQDWFKAMVFGA